MEPEDLTLLLELYESTPGDMRDEATRVEQARSLGHEPLDSFRLQSAGWRACYAVGGASLREAIAKHGEPLRD